MSDADYGPTQAETVAKVPVGRGVIFARSGIAVAVALAIYQIYTAWFGAPPAMHHRVVHLAGVSLVALLSVPFAAGGRDSRLSKAVDILLMLAVGYTATYMLLNYWDMINRFGAFTPADITTAIVGSLVVVELTRRYLGTALLALVLVIIGYAFFGPWLPGNFGHRGYEIDRVASHLYLTTEGIFGAPLGVSATYILIFIIFGKVLHVTGGGAFFINIAMSLGGRFRGGPAIAAVFASGLFGSISGSAAANAVTTGTFTIPLMKRSGFPGRVAAAIEGLASTGGQIAPPVMGAAAFVLSEYTGIPYIQVIGAALIPAVLFYLALTLTVHAYASKNGLQALPSEQLPGLRATFVHGGEHVLPIVVLITLMLMRWTPDRAAVVAMGISIGLSFLRKENRLSLHKLGLALVEAVRAGTVVAIACAAAGAIVGIISLTGVGLQFSSAILAVAGTSTVLALALTAIASIVLGMGMPTTAAYVILAVLAAPALTNLGIPALAAHLFIFYFGVVSNITPPVALAAYAAAGVADEEPIPVAWIALRFGTAGYIIPFLFVFNPSLLGVGGPVAVASAVFSATIGVWLLSMAVVGWAFRRSVARWARLILLVGAIALIAPGVYGDFIGISCALLVYFYLRSSKKPIEHDSVSMGLPHRDP